MGLFPIFADHQSLIMKKSLLYFLCFFFSFQITMAQQNALVPQSSKAVYFDVSPPLRDMLQLTPALVDKSWKDGVVRNYFLNKEDQQPQPGSEKDPGIQHHFGFLPGDTTIINNDGLANVSGYVPPDTYGEAGPDHYFQVVNCSYAIYNKSGFKIFGPYGNSSIWTGMPNNENSGDAVVLYDEAANRWIFTQFSLPVGGFYQMIAVSMTPDPTGPWYRWQYQFSSMPDYPKFGVWQDAYYMSSNNFMGGWVGNGAFAYDRNAMLAGDPDALRIAFNLSPGSDGFITLYPSDCDGALPPAGTPNYFGFIKTGTPQSFGIYEFHADFANPSSSTFGNKLVLPVNSFTRTVPGIPQLGTTTRLEMLDDRLMYRLQYRGFNGYQAMVVNHTVDGASSNSGVRWYEFRKTTGAWSVYQQSTYAPDNNCRWMGSIAMDTAGSIGLAYSISSPTMFPSIRYTGRHKSDPLNQMTIAEKTIVNGGGCQTGSWSGRSRWGDYSGMSVDPAAPTTFWFTTEYYSLTSGSNWQTRIASFTFDNVFSAFTSGAPSLLCQGDSSQLNINAYGGSGNFTYSWSSIPAGFSSTQKDPKVFPTASIKYIAAISDGVTTIHDTVAITLNNPPVSFAGNDTTVCDWLTVMEIDGTAENYKAISWFTSGDGLFGSKTELSTTYTFGPADKAKGSVDLTLFAFAKNPCIGKVLSTRHVAISPCTGLENLIMNTTAISIKPNPAHDQAILVIQGNIKSASTVTITGMDGKTLLTFPLGPVSRQMEKQINLAGFSKGIYMVQLKSADITLKGQLVVQ